MSPTRSTFSASAGVNAASSASAGGAGRFGPNRYASMIFPLGASRAASPVA